ncbi:Metallo-dependent phosphatase-like protein [Lineolata rhizophorae]|uniref:Metallo-dependent phosphatase-like protein n=1 Tax=Lineolata rhizophorae TaxID=578093 RepID=A0A6A6P4V3_9PEZI|nr:Metallo-dependent phosphatase-like protein [Lineolata rhizophorae]
MARQYKDVRFLIMSDTHGMRSDYGDREHPFAKANANAKANVLLHCGDLTKEGTPRQIQAAIRLLKDTAPSAELRLVIPGNHENTLDRHFWVNEWGGDPAEHEEAKAIVKYETENDRRGFHLLDEGVHMFTLRSGATFTIYASPRTPVGFTRSGAFQYNRSIIREYPDGPDIVMTHTPPEHILDSKLPRGRSTGCHHLRNAITRAKPALHCFGHIHKSYGAQRVSYLSANGEEYLQGSYFVGDDWNDEMKVFPKEVIDMEAAKQRGWAQVSDEAMRRVQGGRETLMVNAALLEEDRKNFRPPFVVDLKLPVRH